MKIIYTPAFLIFTLAIICQPAANCQTNPNAGYFDDGGISTAKNILKTDLTNIVKSEISLLYERSLGKSFSVEAGVGVLLESYDYDKYSIWQEFYNDFDPEAPGFSFLIRPKIILGSNFSRTFYFALAWKRTEFNEIFTDDYLIGFGKHYLLGRHIILDLSIDIGIQRSKSLDGTTFLINQDFGENYGWVAILPLRLRLGYLF